MFARPTWRDGSIWRLYSPSKERDHPPSCSPSAAPFERPAGRRPGDRLPQPRTASGDPPARERSDGEAIRHRRPGARCDPSPPHARDAPLFARARRRAPGTDALRTTHGAGASGCACSTAATQHHAVEATTPPRSVRTPLRRPMLRTHQTPQRPACPPSEGLRLCLYNSQHQRRREAPSAACFC